MEPHIIELPRRVVFGRNVMCQIGQICSDMGISGRPLILMGKGMEQTAHVAINSFGMGFSRPFSETVQEATTEEFQRVKQKIGPCHFCAVVSIGGGTVIDIGKLMAIEKRIPFISVPTAPSHDGIASDRVSIKGYTDMKHSVKGAAPMAILADVSILSKAPYRMIASGCADAISNFTAVWDWKLSHKKNNEYYSEYAASLAEMSAEIVLESAEMIKAKNERGIRNLVEALVSSGISMALVSSSRPASGAEHMFSHALEAMGCTAMHGEQCGVGSIITAYMQGQKYASIKTHKLWKEPLWKVIKDTLQTLGAPTTAKELGVDDRVAVNALVAAKAIRKRYTVLDLNKINYDKAEKVCKKVGVIR
jgi:glycerol-1-phosphate dehydrogenase [NAD(P)+]